MKQHTLSAAETAEIACALTDRVARLMLDRAGKDVEAQKELTRRLDVVIPLKRRLGDMKHAAVLTVGSDLAPWLGLDAIREAAADLFGPDAVPAALRDAINEHAAFVASGLLAASWVGHKGGKAFEAAKALVEALGDNVPHDARPELLAFQEALDEAEACALPERFDDKAIDETLADMKLYPAMRNWIAATLSELHRRTVEESK